MNSARLCTTHVLVPALTLLLACGGGGGAGSPTGAGGSGSSGAPTTTGDGTGSTGTGGDLNFASSGGAGTSTGASMGVGGADDCSGELPVILRDFTTQNPDFEPGKDGDDKAIVGPELGADGKPVYAGNTGTLTTHGQASFDQWYNDVAGVNINIPISLKLTPGANGVYTYDNQEFFPIDGKGFGDEGNNHNFHFTDEVHTQFTYKGGEVFTFSGDDDLFAYVNKKLVINLGGVHSAETATVELDKEAANLGLTIGNSYPLDLFGAERHVTQSHYRIDTTIDCFKPVPPPK